MSILSKDGARVLMAGALAVSSALFATASFAQDINLVSPNGTVNLTGELIDFDGQAYTIQSNLGPLRVAADTVDCIGDACPAVDFASLRPVTWSVSLWGKRRAFTEHVEKLAELVADKTEGQFRLNISYGGLSPSRENLDGISRGAFEMAQFCAGYHADKNPSITVLELPFLGVGSMEQELAVSQAVYSHPAVIEDMGRWNATLLMPTPQPQYNIAGSGLPPTSLIDFQKLTVRATGGIGAAINALGASSVNIPAPQVNEALEDGEINAVAFAPHAHMAFETIDSASWWITNLNPGTANCPIAVSTEALNALPSQTRKALLSSVDEALDHFITNYKGSTMAAWDAELTERAISQLTFNDQILDSIYDEVAGPAARDWIARNTALGLPAKELYNLVAAVLKDDAPTSN